MILDHYTIHTADLERSRQFYQDILGLTAGYRPPFEGPPGAWLYGPNERPVVHLYAGRQSVATDVGAMDHIAFLVDELRPIIEKLRKYEVYFETARVPEIGSTQVFFRDPDGLQIELNHEPE